MGYLILLPILIPILAGILLFMLPGGNTSAGNSNHLNTADENVVKKPVFGTGMQIYVLFSLMLTFASVVLQILFPSENAVTLINLVDGIALRFHGDGLAMVFSMLTAVIWPLVGIYAFSYMEHEGHEKRFFGFYLVLFGVLEGMCYASNLVTLYLFFELMTLTSFPMVLHNGSRESIMASLKYLFYSMFGAYAALFGIFILSKYAPGLEFAAGGSLKMELAAGNESILLLAVFMTLVGFGVKGGLLPFHAWLPTAHPVAPSPASAVLSAIIVKFGVLAIIRTTYFVVGPSLIRGTTVQYAWIVLATITVFMGSMLAFREKTFKKRLAYSTVSQVSYILLALGMFTETAFVGALLHTVAHAVIKSGLFMTAGVFIYKFEKTKVEEFQGLGKKMPALFWGYTFLSLGLIGIPPTSGFISKWYLAIGSLESNVSVFAVIGVATLLVSALLTAGYLLPITMNGFFKEEESPAGEMPVNRESTDADKNIDSAAAAKKYRLPLTMLLPILVLAVITLAIGLFPNTLIDLFTNIAKAVLY